MDLKRIQDALQRLNLDGWLFFDHHERDPLAYRILGFHPGRHVSRRWYYLIPAHGEPRKLVHRIEAGMLDPVPGITSVYSKWQEQHALLAELLSGMKRVAMQYSPECTVVYVSMVDAGTVELVRRLGTEVVSSAELVQEFEAQLSDEQFATHVEAGKRVDLVRAEAFQFMTSRIAGGVTELDVRDFVRARFAELGLITDSGPIVGVNGHAGNPHYEPTPASNVAIRPGDLVLLDMWAKLEQPGAIYYDITWTGFCGDAPEKIRHAFDVVKGARDAGVRMVQNAVAHHADLRGFQVDDAVRGHIEAAGLGDYFLHRTGHSIGTEVHGSGANMDNLETHDERPVQRGSLFSIEPGVYFDDFGVRLELDVFVGASSTGPTGTVQTDLVKI